VDEEKAAKPKTGTKDGNWDSSAQLQTALDTMCKVLKLKLSKIFLTTSERDTFISLFTRPVYMVLEKRNQRVKNTAIRMHSFKVFVHSSEASRSRLWYALTLYSMRGTDKNS